MAAPLFALALAAVALALAAVVLAFLAGREHDARRAADEAFWDGWHAGLVCAIEGMERDERDVFTKREALDLLELAREDADK